MNGQTTAFPDTAISRHATLLVAEPTQRAKNHEPATERYCPRNNDEQRLLDALAMVVDPCSIATGAPLSIYDLGLIMEIVVSSDTATIKLRLTNPFCFQIGIICEAIEKKVHALGLACVIEVDPVDPWSTDLMTDDAKERLRKRRQA